MEEAEGTRQSEVDDEAGRGTRAMWGESLGEIGVTLVLVGVVGLDECFIALRSG